MESRSLAAAFLLSLAFSVFSMSGTAEAYHAVNPTFSAVTGVVANPGMAPSGFVFSFMTSTSSSTTQCGPNHQYICGIKLFVCRTPGATSSGCTGGTWCTSQPTQYTSNPRCDITAPSVTANHSYYAYIFDNTLAAPQNPRTGYFTSDNARPTGNVSNKPANATTSETVNFTINASDNVLLRYVTLYRTGWNSDGSQWRSVLGSCFPINRINYVCNITAGPFAIQNYYNGSNPLYYFASIGDVASYGWVSSNILTTPINRIWLSNPFDFNVTAPPKGAVSRGGSANFSVSLSLLVGPTSPVSMSASGLPPNSSASFSQPSCSPGCSVGLNISAADSAPEGSYNVSIVGTSGSIVRSASYNLTVLPPTVCGNAVCENPETQSSCPADCSTTVSMPSPIAPGEVVQVGVAFRDWRYEAGGPVRLDLRFDSPTGTAWTDANGCFLGGQKMSLFGGPDSVAWPPATVSQDGYFNFTTLCTVPANISAGSHLLFGTPTIY